jgi:diaminopimelate decarboxylase
LTADAGTLLTKVTATKNDFLGLDAGMHTLLRPALYQTFHQIEVADGTKRETKPWTVVGQICENTDRFTDTYDLPSNLREGNLMAIHTVGAYGYGMSMPYNTRPRAAEVMVCQGEARLIRKRETLNDLLAGVTTREAEPIH